MLAFIGPVHYDEASTELLLSTEGSASQQEDYTMPSLGVRSSPLVVLGFVAVTAIVVIVDQAHQNHTPNLIVLDQQTYWMKTSEADVYADMRAASKWLEERRLVPRAVIMDQREVATRLANLSIPLDLKNKLSLEYGLIFDCTQSHPPDP